MICVRPYSVDQEGTTRSTVRASTIPTAAAGPPPGQSLVVVCGAHKGTYMYLFQEANPLLHLFLSLFLFLFLFLPLF